MKSTYRLLGMLALCMTTLVWSGCDESTPTLTEASPSNLPQFSGPKEGSLMAMGDGSVLVFIPSPDGVDSNGQKGFWITLNAISNYQFSLCVQAGHCKAPTDPTALADFDDKTKIDLPVSIIGPDIVGPDRSAGYCGWAGGRAPTDAEIKAFGDGSVRGFADGSVRGFADGSVHTFGAGEAGIQDDTVRGVHCVFDQPLPAPQFFGMSPYYDPAQPMESMVPEVSKSVQFCQDKQGYQTLDFQLDDDERLFSVNGDGRTNCQQVNANRIVCYGESNANFQAEVGFQCDGARNLSCPAGSEFNGDGCSASSNFGMDDWELNANGVLMPSNGTQLPAGGFLGPKVPNLVIIHGVMMVESLSLNSLPENGSSSNGLASNGNSTNGVNGDGRTAFQPLAFDCPTGFYFDDGAQACASLGAPQTECLSGFHFNGDGRACESDQENGNYPGCPKGELLNPLTGQCDANSQVLSSTSFVAYIPMQVQLPDCTPKIKPAGGADEGGTGDLCPVGQVWSCYGKDNPVCSCK